MAPNVIVSERHDDSLEITEHPVEVDAAISDHAFRRPLEMAMQAGSAGGGSLLDFVDTSFFGLSVGIGPKETYQELLNLQSSRVLLDVVTGKRIYTNMLIHALETVTGRTSESILSAVLTLREMIIAGTTTTHVTPKSNMKLGVNISAVQNSRMKTPVQKNESILSRLSGFVTGE